MEKAKIYEAVVKNGKTLANKAHGEVNQKIRILQNICKTSDNYEVIEDCVQRIARLRGIKHEINTYTPETVSDAWRIGPLMDTIRNIENVC